MTHDTTDPAGSSPAGKAANLFALLLVSWVLASDAFNGAITAGLGAGDFRCFYDAAMRLRTQQPLYLPASVGHGLYNYFSTLAIALIPLSKLSFVAASRMWAAGNVLLVFASAAVFCRTMRITSRATVSIIIILITGIRWWPATTNFALGQTNFLLLFLVTIGGCAYARGKLGLLCAAIVIGALIKTWMVGWIGFLLLKRMWREFLTSTAVIIGIAGASFVVVGVHEFRPFLDITRDFASGKTGGWIVSQSLPAFTTFHLEHRAATIMTLVGAGIVFYAMITELWLTPRTIQASRAFLETGFFSLSLLLMLPYCDPTYFLLCAPIFWVLLAPAADCAVGLSNIRRLFSYAAAAVLFVAMTRSFAVGGFDPGTLAGCQRYLATAYFCIMSCVWVLAWATLLSDRQRRRRAGEL